MFIILNPIIKEIETRFQHGVQSEINKRRHYYQVNIESVLHSNFYKLLNTKRKLGKIDFGDENVYSCILYLFQNFVFCILVF